MNPSSTPNNGEFTNRDLIELAQLDALGLLDESERQAFEKAFRSAPASIQMLVREGQARAADLDAWLPEAQPPASLRQRVLAAVAAAVRSESTQPEVAGRLAPPIAKSSTVAPFWRATAIGSIAAALLFGVVTLKLYADFQNVNSTLQANAVADKFLKEFGPKFEQAFTSEKTKFVQFAPSTGARGAAVMLMDEGSATAQFFAKDLPTVEGGYTLALVDAQGNVVKTIAHLNTGASRYVDQYAELHVKPGESFVLKTAARDEAVMRSNNL
ncbi:MAG: hypothetical protein QM783_04545 [Phycisphaerales bacterium]